MFITGFNWVGVPTSSFIKTSQFYKQVFGFSPFRYDEKRHSAHFKFASGHHFEIFKPHNRYDATHTCPAIAFQVEDIEAARRELDSHGLDFITEIDAVPGEAWCYFRTPDGYLYELVQVEDSEKVTDIQSNFIGYNFVGITAVDLDAAAGFYSNILGLSAIPTSTIDHLSYRLPSGQLFELFGPNNEYGWRYDCLVLGFQVNDIKEAYNKIEVAGAEIIKDIYSHQSDASWFYFRGPDGAVYSASSHSPA